MSIFTTTGTPAPRTEPVTVDGVTEVDGRAFLNERSQRRHDQGSLSAEERAAHLRTTIAVKAEADRVDAERNTLAFGYLLDDDNWPSVKAFMDKHPYLRGKLSALVRRRD